MGRPKKKTIEYFSHYANTRNDRRMKALRNSFGVEGFGVYFLTLELLSETENQRLPYNDEIEVELISGDFGIQSETLKKIWKKCQELRLLTIDDEGLLFSKEIDDCAARVYEKRGDSKRRYEKAKEKKGNDSKSHNQEVSETETSNSESETKNLTPENTQKKRKEKKEKPPNPLVGGTMGGDFDFSKFCELWGVREGEALLKLWLEIPPEHDRTIAKHLPAFLEKNSGIRKNYRGSPINYLKDQKYLNLPINSDDNKEKSQIYIPPKNLINDEK